MRRLAAILAAPALLLAVLVPMALAAPPALIYSAHVGGHNARTVASPLPAWAATASGTNSPGGIAFGHLEITATPTALTARYVADAGNTAYSDSFVVAR